MKVKLSMSCLMLAMALGAPAALAASDPEVNGASMSLVADPPAMTEEELKRRMDAAAEALQGGDAGAIRKALAAVSASHMAISDEQVRTILDQLKALASRYPAHSDQIKSNLFKVEHLTIGRVAPNIKGKDTDGVEFELEDYRGKVVVVDFWGDW